MQFTILRFDLLGSTNDEAARQARLGAAEGLCIVARQQTAGRGRRERIWYSPPDAGLYFSIVLQPKIEAKKTPLITLAAAVAVSNAIADSCKLETDIKWSNDVHTKHGKKLAGILAEMVNANAVVLGIGINLTNEAIAPELREIASSIEAEIITSPNADDLLIALTNNLKKYYQVLHEESGGEQIIAAWTRRSTYASGKNVSVKLENELFFGTTDGLQPDGALRVRLESGLIKVVYAGDVLAVRSAG